MLPDLKFYYGIDLVETIQGRGVPPALVLLYVERLPDDSLTHALMLGDAEHFGWGTDRHLLASIYDILTLNTQASGNWAKKPPDLPFMQRPSVAVAEPKKRTSVLDIYARFKAL